MISASVAPYSAFHQRDHFGFLVVACDRGFDSLLAWAVFFAGLAFLAGVRLPLGCGAPGSGVVVFSVSIVFVFIVFLLDRAAVVTIHHSEWEKHRGNSSTIRLRPRQADIRSGELAGCVPFL
jgi:hypothetical protein